MFPHVPVRLQRAAAHRHISWGLAPAPLALLYVGLVAYFRDSPRPQEMALFRRLNSGPELVWLRVPQQLGTPWGPVAAALVMMARGRRIDAGACLMVLPVEKAVEVSTKKLLERSRPVHETPTVLRDDAPLDGPSMPSGHAALATASVVLLARGTAPTVTAGMACLASATALTRVHQGAHWPSDVLAGGVMGASIGLALMSASNWLRGTNLHGVLVTSDLARPVHQASGAPWPTSRTPSARC